MSGNAVANANSVRSITPMKDAAAVPWGDMWHQAAALVSSGFLPSAVKTPEQAIAIILTGDELGIPKMLALRSIHVVQGRPTLSADLMASLVLREIDRHKDGLLMVQPPTPEACTVRFRRWGWLEEQSYTYTIADAQRAGLVGKDTWKAHPAAMLRARATAAVCRMAFPDVVAGLYAIGEVSEDEAWEPSDAVGEPLRPEPRVDVVEAQVRGLPGDDPEAPIDVDYSTGELLSGQQALPENGVEMLDRQQRGRVLFLAGKLGWGMDAVNGFAADMTGISNIDLLSRQRAAYLIEQMEGQLPAGKQRAS